MVNTRKQKREEEMRLTVRTTLAVLLTATGGGMAWGHPVLEGSDPGQDATVSSPKEIRLTFTENLIAKFSGLTIKDQSGRPIRTASPSVDPNDKRRLIVPISTPLPPGAYDVDWHAVGADTHRVTGHFSFRVVN
jgi:methionine-rich copper-binding protein CopC